MVIVTGTACSGTSLIAAICSALGVDMGVPLRKTSDNAYPFTRMEHVQFNDLHKLYLKNGPLCNDLKDINEDTFLCKVLAIASCYKEPWGFKSYNTSRFINYYVKAFPSAKFICTQRPLDHIVKSSIAKSLGPVIVKDREAYFKFLIEHLSKHLPSNTLYIDFEALRKKPELHIQTIANFIEQPYSKEVLKYVV